MGGRAGGRADEGTEGRRTGERAGGMRGLWVGGRLSRQGWRAVGRVNANARLLMRGEVSREEVL